jgi:hypothetical protein
VFVSTDTLAVAGRVSSRTVHPGLPVASWVFGVGAWSDVMATLTALGCSARRAVICRSSVTKKDEKACQPSVSLRQRHLGQPFFDLTRTLLGRTVPPCPRSIEMSITSLIIP